MLRCSRGVRLFVTGLLLLAGTVFGQTFGSIGGEARDSSRAP